jgi:hypothetical protein
VTRARLLADLRRLDAMSPRGRELVKELVELDTAVSELRRLP